MASKQCTRCLGLGIVDDRGFVLVGQPYFSTQPCPECLGKKPVPVKERDPLFSEHVRTIDKKDESCG